MLLLTQRCGRLGLFTRINSTSKPLWGLRPFMVTSDQGRPDMTLKTARALTWTYLVLAILAVTWPGILPFARIRPLIFGLPFSMAWIATWVAGCVVVFGLLELVERKHRTEGN